ncbi:MAG TPA: hypothetical protein VFP87_14560 [Chitinophagaceae bacterium]|nr:hypothetical protein [Chitinophagaceae bacterium]
MCRYPADTSLLIKNIYAAEDSMVAIMKRKDWNAYADYMHPAVIELSGGREGFSEGSDVCSMAICSGRYHHRSLDVEGAYC